jgi:hypothetical protein
MRTVIDLVCLALGPRYQAKAFQIQLISPSETFSSGLQSKERVALLTVDLSLSMITINDASKRLDQIQDGQPLRVILLFAQTDRTFIFNAI